MRTRWHECHRFEQIGNIFHRSGAREGSRPLRHGYKFLGMVQQGKNLTGQTFAGQLFLGQDSRGARRFHGLRVSQLMRIGGGAERYEDGGTTGGGDFRRCDRARAADD
jgi:hypothetical protein